MEGLTTQVLDEGGEGSRSGAEHTVAVQRAENPLQTGQDLQTCLRFNTSLQNFNRLITSQRL